jgi:hypothetical protein
MYEMGATGAEGAEEGCEVGETLKGEANLEAAWRARYCFCCIIANSVQLCCMKGRWLVLVKSRRLADCGYSAELLRSLPCMRLSVHGRGVDFQSTADPSDCEWGRRFMDTSAVGQLLQLLKSSVLLRLA